MLTCFPRSCWPPTRTSPGQFGWDGGRGTTAYADPEEGLVGVMLTQTAMDSADAPRLHQDFWTTVYQTV